MYGEDKIGCQGLSFAILIGIV